MTQRIFKLDEFRELRKELQFELLHQDGVYVGKRAVGDQSLILFQLYDFYVEVHYTSYRREINHLEISTDMEMLLPYLDQVQVRDLKKNREE